MSSLKDSLIAKKYAEALAEVKLSEDLLKQLTTLQVLINENPDFRSFLLNPGIKKETKITLIKNIFTSNFEPELVNTLLVLLDRRRVSVMSLMADAYKEVFNRKNNTYQAELSSATELSQAELEQIKAKLETLFNKSVKINHKIDESLIAGMKINIDNKMIDASLEKKMSKLRDLMNI